MRPWASPLFSFQSLSALRAGQQGRKSFPSPSCWIGLSSQRFYSVPESV
jgi:hypothetical protein